MTTRELVDSKVRETAAQAARFYARQKEVEDEIHRFWSPHRGQAPIAYALFRQLKSYIFMQCGRKFGKTDFALYCMIMYAIIFPNSQIYYIADTMKHAGELVWDNGRLPRFFLSPKRQPDESQEEYQLRRQIGQALHDKYILKINESEMRVYFTNGSFIKVDGAENYANADGIEPDFIVYDEFKHHDPRFNEAMEPNLVVKGAPLLIVGTPPEEINTYYEKIAVSISKMSDGFFCRRPSFLNPMVYPLGERDPRFVAQLAKYRARGEEDVIERELYAKIVRGGSRAIFPVLELPEWDYESSKYVGYSRHLRPHDELMEMIRTRHKDWEFHVIFDPASTSCFGTLVMALNKRTGVVVVMDEIYEKEMRKMSTRKIYPLAQEKWRAVHGYDDHWERTYDNAAAWFANEVLDYYGDALNPCDKDLKNKENKLSLIKDMLVYGRLLISERCHWLIWEMENYRKDEDGKIPKENDHLLDCLRYGLNAMAYNFADYDVEVPQDQIDERRGYRPELDEAMETARITMANLLPRETYEE